MAMSSHIAVARASARVAHQKANETHHDLSSGTEDIGPESNLENSLSELSQMSVISIGGDLQPEAGPSRLKSSGSTSATPRPTSKTITLPKVLIAPLEQINSQSDLEDCVDEELHQHFVLNRLEQKWLSISENFETVLNHLQQCSDEVTEASTNCLQSLLDSVELTCDKVDIELGAMYDLMRRCDEMTTKLSVASSFRDEIKTLRKSVETLDQLHKSRPQSNQKFPSTSAT